MIQKINTPHGKATIYRLGVPMAEQYIVLSPGYSETITHCKELVDMLAGKGYSALTYSQPRRGYTSDLLGREKTIVLSLIGATIPAGKKTHVVTHSYSAAAVLRAALERPELFASVLLMQPSGMAGNQSLFKVVRQIGKKMIETQAGAIRDRRAKKQAISTGEPQERSASFRQVLSTQLASTAMVVKNPLLSLQEAKLVVRHSIVNDIAAVKQLGIPVYVISAYSDELFNLTKSGVGYEDIVTLPGAYISVADKHARHDTFWIHADRTTRLIDILIRQRAPLSQEGPND